MGTREPILYRWWDADGRLLYVGKSISLFARMQAHRRSSRFFAEAAAMTLERLPNEIELAHAEMRAIRTEGPLYNIVGAGGAQTRRIAMEDGFKPQPFDSNLGHWSPLETDGLMVGQVIRWSDFDESHIGFVDDDEYGDPEGESDDGLSWIVIEDTGSEVEISSFELPFIESVEVWVAVDGSVPDGIFDAYYERARRRAA